MRSALVLTLLTVGSVVPVSAQNFVNDVPLLNVTEGQLPDDTALDGRSALTIVAAPWDATQKALRVQYAAGDSFGLARGAGQRNWSRFRALTVSIWNPGDTPVSLAFVIKHARSRDVSTRVEQTLQCSRGINDFRWILKELTNGDGSTPDLSEITHWYFANPGNQTPLLFFSDVLLHESGQPQQDQSAAGRWISPARVKRLQQATLPAITAPVEFDTPAADAILSQLEIFPPDNAFNQVIEDWPLHPRSRQIVASIGADQPFRYNPDMGFVIVPPDQPRVPVRIVDYPGESDPGPYPVPDNVPIEGWPAGVRREGDSATTLQQLQRRPEKYIGDRHAIVVDPHNHRLYEFFTFGRTDSGWAAGQASVFDLSSNALRPDGWTSADAAGLPIFPAVVRYDDLQRGIVDHAMRVTVRRSRRAWVHPATHFASRLTDADLPRMGERLRLRGDYDITGFSKPVQAILKGLKKHGMFVADNGIDWAISVAPDPRIPILHEELRRIRGRDFQVVIAPTHR